MTLPVINREVIPAELKASPRWINWLPVPDPGDPIHVQKKPVDPRTGGVFEKGSDFHHHPERWVSFEEIIKTNRPVGFVLGLDAATGHTFAGLDIDDCIVRGELQPWVRRLLKAFPTYVEISPSGTGIKAFMFATLPGPIQKTAGIELYGGGRFFTVTGQVLHV